MKYSISIGGEEYEVVDALNNITLADSFVKNKLGNGHGEAKLYVGNENDRYKEFFDDLSRESFFIKEDFDKYLLDARPEFFDPQQDYIKKNEMQNIYMDLNSKLGQYKKGILKFKISRVDVEPPRVYLNSTSEYYDLTRSMGLPNISYLSILKLKSKMGKIYYYYRMFIEYKNDLIKYETPLAKQEENKISNSQLSSTKKETLIQARIGQGKYRKNLIEDCQYCPITLVNDERLLIASHIKPWSVSNDKEKIDCKNGFALTPTFDKLFDNGFITFRDDKKMLVSPWISPMNQKRLCIYSEKDIPKLQLDEQRCRYLEYHRNNIYKG